MASADHPVIFTVTSIDSIVTGGRIRWASFLEMNIFRFFRKTKSCFSRVFTCRSGTFEKTFEEPVFKRNYRSYRRRTSCSRRPTSFRRCSVTRSTFESSFVEAKRAVFTVQYELFLEVPRIFDSNFLDRLICNIECIRDYRVRSRATDFREQLI